MRLRSLSSKFDTMTAKSWVYILLRAKTGFDERRVDWHGPTRRDFSIEDFESSIAFFTSVYSSPAFCKHFSNKKNNKKNKQITSKRNYHIGKVSLNRRQDFFRRWIFLLPSHFKGNLTPFGNSRISTSTDAGLYELHAVGAIWTG